LILSRNIRNDRRLISRFIANIQGAGVKVLTNTATPFSKGGRLYNIIGISDYTTDNHDIAIAYNEIIPENAANIVLSHNPDIVFELPRDKTDYLFSGHLHGGQIRAPFNFEFIVLRDDKLGRMGVIKGLNRLNDIKVYINRGLGNVVFPLRFLSRPELTILYLQ
jgi:predicted MPP superfamily phosphohydrolase